ncbi:antireceptor [Streptococcus phage SW2]|uniref:Antireceptor n=1 Tax=Streptococcus phage SW2 TaxID=2419640 RepID=A0A3S5H0N2_9CAUD|nr:virion structural protein [Streptococcus phage SW2]AYP29131.1 antireceptor [Streptococcus phage SW2]
MQIWIHDKSMRKVCALNNNVPGMLPYSNSQWHTYLEYSTSTLDFVIPKIVNGKLHDDIKYINDQMYVSFYYDNSYHVFYVAKIVENDFSFQVTCNNTNLELAMEVARPLADSGGPKTIEWCLQNLELLGFAGLEIGVNEISDRTRTLTFESQSGTKLEQLHSLMNQFDAEFIFRTELNRDGTLKKFVIDIYHRPDKNHHGIGKARGDVVLYYQSGLKGVQVTSDKTQLFNAGVFTGADGVNLDSVEFEEKNGLGQVEFYSRKGTSFVFAPISRERYPSTMNPDSADNWTRKDFQTEYKDVESLKAYALRTIKQYAYPLLTYTVDVQSSFLDNYKDINLGDTIKIVDNNFRGGLALEARVSEMIISFDNPANNSVVFTNFKKLDNKPSDALQQRIDEIVSKSLPYHVEIRTTNGTVFKNGVGHSTVKPILKQGDKIVNATYRFVIDGTIKYSGMTYDMVASEINQPTTLTISAWVDNKEVASEEVTFVNVSDGKQGPKGDRGNDGLPGKDGIGLKTTTITYGLSDSDSTQPTDWTSQPPALVKGKYLWTKTVWTYTDSSSETGYQKTYIAKDGNDGTDGLPGKDGVGIKTTTITYAQGISGTVPPTNGWNSQVPNVPAGQYLWTKTIWDYTDNTSETGYSVAKMGEKGPKGDRGERGLQGPKGDQGIPGPKGADGRTQYTHIAYANSPDGNKDFSTSDSNREYIGIYVDFNIDDSNNPSDYSWTLVKGADGAQGVPGKPGADGKTPYFHTAWSYSADGTDGFTTVYPNLNLLEGTKYFSGDWWGRYGSQTDGTYKGLTVMKRTAQWVGISKTFTAPKDGTYTFSAYVKSSGNNVDIIRWININGVQDVEKAPMKSLGNNFDWFRDYFTLNLKAKETASVSYNISGSGSGTLWTAGHKWEEGPKATPWMPSASEVTTADYPSFIGQYTNYTQVDSPNPRDYTWSLIRGNDGKQGPQGIPGPKGADGRTQYTHIAYADTISGSGFSQTDVNKAYIGMYQDFNAEDSKNPQDYRWSKWKGSDGKDGIPGPKGADGRTPYVHFAYADSADGQKGFSLTQTGRKRYLGVLTNFFKEDSTNPSDYTWNDTAGSISVGGRNLLVKTNQGITNWNWQLSDGDKSVEEVKVDGIRAVKLIKGSTAANTGWNFIEYNGLLRELIQPKSKYVLSFDVKPSVDVTFYATLARGDFNEPLTDTVAMPKALANQWNKVSCVLTSKETLPNIAGQVVYLAGMPTTNGNWVIIKNIKLEEGDIPTQWTPAIEDIQDEIDSKADAAMTIEQINALNEMAGIIKAEMEAKASAEVLNNWIKNYQDFVKANETERAAAEKALVSSSQRVSTIAKELGELSDRWNFIDTYMSSSNDGLVIGKNDGSSSIMFNPNGRISMYSAGEEVMYISQGVIHIENGIFSKTIQVGRYREEQYHLNPDMNVIRYVGGF